MRHANAGSFFSAARLVVFFTFMLSAHGTLAASAPVSTTPRKLYAAIENRLTFKLKTDFGGLRAPNRRRFTSPRVGPPPLQASSRNVSLNEVFERAAKDFNVPRDLLVAIAFVETRFNDRKGAPSKDNGYGLMHLVDNPQAQTLTTAARAIAKPPETLKTDIEQNIRGGAAILSSYADQQGLTGASRQDLSEWYVVVARYSNAESDEVASLYGDEVFKVLTTGLSVVTRKGETITIAAREIQPKKGKYGNVVITRSTDLPPTRGLNPVMKIASLRNFSVAHRAKDYPIRYIVIHTTQGSYAGTISWFQNPKAHVSAHYVVRSSDGNIAQVVLDKDMAWHAGNRKYNQQAIGIEHEGFIEDAAWYTDTMYKSSAALTRALCTKYGIPMDRAHIIGHYEIRPQKNKHTDPGRLWNWDKYMREMNPEGFRSRGIRKKKSQRTRPIRRQNHATASAPPEAQMTFVLQVGIDAYQYVNTLDGCVQDVQDMKQVLIQKFNLAPQNILTLTNRQATHKGIIDAFRTHLIANAKRHPNAVVIFQYSGHGSQVDDTNGDESDGLDETIVSVDSRDPQNKNFDITDDELGDLFAELSQYTSNITFILDSCHSGSASRGTNKVRRVAKDTRPQPSQPSLSATRSGTRTRDAETTDILPWNERYVTISGSSSDELSNEMSTSSGTHRKVNGALSFYLIRALQQAKPDTTYRELMADVSNAVSLQYPSQHPQVEGDIRRLVFAGVAKREDPFIRVSARRGSLLTLEAGAAQGIKVGSPIAIYSPDAHTLSGDQKKLATGKIQKVSDFTSMALLLEPATIPKYSKAVLIAPNYGTAKLRVALDPNAFGNTPFVSEFRDWVKESLSLELIPLSADALGSSREWDVAVLRDQFGSIFKDIETVAPSASSDSTLPSAQIPVYYLAGRDGRALFGFFVKPDDKNGPQKIGTALEQLAKLRALKSLVNRTSTLKRGFRLTPIRVMGTRSESGFKIERQDLLSADQLTYPSRVGDYFKFQIENLTSKDMYVTLFDLSTNGTIEILFPPAGAAELLRAGDKITPRELFEVTGPSGYETFKIIATTEKTDFSFLKQMAVMKGRSPLESLMDLVLSPRGTTVVKVAGQDDWTTGQIDFVIKEKNQP